MVVTPLGTEDGNRFWDSLSKIVTAISVVIGIIVGLCQYSDQVELQAIKPIRDKQFQMYNNILATTEGLVGIEHAKTIGEIGDKLR